MPRFYYGPNGYQPNGEFDKAMFPTNEKFIYFPPHDNTNMGKRGYPLVIWVYGFRCGDDGHFYLASKTEAEAQRKRENIPWGGATVRIKYCLRYSDEAWAIAVAHAETRDAFEAQYDSLIKFLSSGDEVTAVEVPKLPKAIKQPSDDSPQLALF